MPRIAALALVLFAASPAHAQPWQAGETWDGPAPEAVRCEVADGVLPAGVYWATIGWYDANLDCAAPRFAVVAAVTASERELARATARARTLSLAPGYPWVTHTRQAGLEGDGVAVVLGLFATRERADVYAQRHGARVIGVLSREDAIDRFDDESGGRRPDPIPAVTHVTAPSAVAALSLRDIAHAEEAWNDTYRPDDPQAHRRRASVERARRIAAARPLCRVAPDRVFVFTTPPAARVELGMGYRSWEPVRCGGQLAWIPREATQAEAVVWTARDGGVVVTQVTLVECDVPTHTSWNLDADRARTRKRVTSSGGC